MNFPLKIRDSDLPSANRAIENETLAGKTPTRNMKKKRHTVDQIIKLLGQVDEGCDIEIACREHNIAKATFHRRRRKYGKMEMKDAKRLKELEKGNTELKKIVADQMLNIRVLEAVNAKKW